MRRTGRRRIGNAGRRQVALFVMVAAVGALLVSCGSGSGTPPGAPSGLTWQGDGANTVLLQWAQPSRGLDNVSGYDVYRNGVLIGATKGRVHTFYVDDSLVPGTALSYSVKAVDSAGDQSRSSAALVVDTINAQQGSFTLAATFGPTYCRRGGDSSSIATQDLECTFLHGSTWTTSISPAGIDWGYNVGWAWVSDQGNPAYCRRTGVPSAKFASQHLECTVFNGSTWSTATSPAGIDWGYDVGWGWVSDQGNPAYCRRGGGSGSIATQDLECTVFDGTNWTTSVSPPGIDWGYDVGWAWVSDQGNPAYCRRTGDPSAQFARQHLSCTDFTGTSWVTSSSPPGIDWGYDVGWGWVSSGGNPVYCRRGGDSGTIAKQDLECTGFNGQKWFSSVSPTGIDWGYGVGWAWVTARGDPAYCRRTGDSGALSTQHLACTIWNGLKWSSSTSPAGIDWGYDAGSGWVSNQEDPTYCRHTGVAGSATFANQHLSCTTYYGLAWATSNSPGGIDWGYDIGSQWLGA